MRKMPPGYGAINAIRFVLVTCLITCTVESRSVAGEGVSPTPILVSRIATDGDFVTLPVRVDDRRLVFMVDTGSSTTTFDTSFRNRLAPAGEAERRRVAPDEEASELFMPPSMTVTGTDSGAIPFPRDCPVVCRDLAEVREVSSFPIQGVIGMDFLAAYALELDLVEGRICLYADAGFTKKSWGDVQIGMSIPLQRPCLEIESAGVFYWALIDTGALLSLDIERDAYEYLMARRQITEVMFMVSVGDRWKVGATDEGWLRELKVGPFRHRDISINVHRVSLLGLYYWRRYHCVFDFPGKTIYLKKNRFFDVRDDTDHAGIYVEPAEGAADARRVAYVALASAADRAGVRVDDYLVSVDGRKVGADSQHSIYRRLSFRHDRPCELVLSRQGSEIRITLPASGFGAAVRD